MSLNKDIYIGVEKAITLLQQSCPIILTDDKKRENEGDLICPVQTLNIQVINFMIKHCGGMVCATITQNQADKFQLPIIEQRNVNKNMANFTLPIESSTDITTGISAKDRYKSIMTLTDQNSVLNDISVPGHIMPIVIQKQGLKKRKGHTEGSATISKISKLGINTVICEILDEQGDSSRNDNLINFALMHRLKIVTIDSIYNYLEKNKIGFDLY